MFKLNKRSEFCERCQTCAVRLCAGGTMRQLGVVCEVNLPHCGGPDSVGNHVSDSSRTRTRPSENVVHARAVYTHINAR